MKSISRFQAGFVFNLSNVWSLFSYLMFDKIISPSLDSLSSPVNRPAALSQGLLNISFAQKSFPRRKSAGQKRWVWYAFASHLYQEELNLDLERKKINNVTWQKRLFILQHTYTLGVFRSTWKKKTVLSVFYSLWFAF